MSYRKITVDGKEYEYSIGKKYTKIRGGEVFENSKIGNPIVDIDHDFLPTYRVTPRNVKHAILGLPIPEYKNAAGENVTEFLIDPFDAEIHDKITYFPYCSTLYYTLRDEI